MKTCTVKGCREPHLARGYCVNHYYAWRKHGDPTKVVLKQHHGKTLKERCEIYTKKGPGCWEWTGYKDPNGYGRLNVKNIPVLAHRVSYEQNVGSIPEGKVLCHTCDNPGCVNPAHLFIGEQADNVADMQQKGRSRKRGLRGSQHNMAVLTEPQVRAIRASDLPARHFAELYDVSTTTIYDVRNRRIWTHI